MNLLITIAMILLFALLCISLMAYGESVGRVRGFKQCDQIDKLLLKSQENIIKLQEEIINDYQAEIIKLSKRS